MINIQKIRKLILNLLEYYTCKEIRNNKNDYYYYSVNLKNYDSEFMCLLNEKKIGLYSNLNKIDLKIIFRLLQMLYERDYMFLVNIYNMFIFEIQISFVKSLENINFWLELFNKYYKINEVNIIKHANIPQSLKNYKTKKTTKFYKIEEIRNTYFN